MATVHAVRSSRIVTPTGVQPGVVVILDGKILAITPIGETFDSLPVMDVEDHMILPGLVDVHSQLNEPGRTDWDGFEAGTKAAAAGGFTTIIDMPFNALPSNTSVEALAQKRAAVFGKASVDYAFWAGVVPHNFDEVSALAEAGVRGFKCLLVAPSASDFTALEKDSLGRVMPAIAETGLPLLAYAELPKSIEEAKRRLDQANWQEHRAYIESRSEDAETEATQLVIELVRKHRCSVHIVHLSEAKAIASLEAARTEGLPITVETCPYYLYFAAENIPNGGTQFKSAPPIREAVNQALLWEALRSGDIDMIATDHSPCPDEIKCAGFGDFRTAWGGIISLSVSLPAIWTAARERGFHITDVARWMADQPSVLSGLSASKGRIAPGCDADLVIFDPDDSFEVASDLLETEYRFSPYIGERLKGRLLTTILRGEIVYNQGRFAALPTGREVR